MPRSGRVASSACQCLAKEAVGKGLRDADRDVAARCGKNGLRGGEVDRLVLRAAANHLIPLPVVALDHKLHYFTKMPLIVHALGLALAVEQNLQPLEL